MICTFDDLCINDICDCIAANIYLLLRLKCVEDKLSTSNSARSTFLKYKYLKMIN